MKLWLKKIAKFVGLFIFSLYCLIWLLSPTITRFFSSDILKLALNENDLVLVDRSSIRYNPFLSKLSIHNLAIIKEDSSPEIVFSIDSLELEVDLYKLIVGDFYISTFEINGLLLNIVINDKNIEIAGVPIVPANAQNSAPKHKDATDELTTEVSAFIVKMPQFDLFNAKININLNNHLHHIGISSLGIERVHASALEQQMNINLKATIDDAPLLVDVMAKLNNGVGVITTTTNLEHLNLSNYSDLLPQEVTSLAGFFNYKSHHEITLNKNAIIIDIKNLTAKTEHIEIITNDIKTQFNDQVFNSDNTQITLEPEQPVKVNLHADFKLNNLTISDAQGQNILLDFEQFLLTNIVLTTKELTHQIAIDKINLLNATFSKNISNNALPLATFNQFSVEDIQLSEQGISVQLATLSGLAIDAILDKNKALTNLITLPQSASTNTDEVVTSSPKNSTNTTPNQTLYLGEFKILDDVSIYFSDNSVSPAYQQNFTINTFMLGPIDNQNTTQKTLFEVSGKSQKYAHFNFKGFSLPFVEQPVHHIEGAFKEVSLPAISTYMKDALQYVFDSGQLDLSVNTTLTGEIIKGDMGILIRGLELTAAEDDEVGSIKDQTAIPFSVALGMLKDRDGNVELDIPLSGNTSDPSFGVSGFLTLVIKQATMSAAQSYLMTTFVPYSNVISVAMTAGDYLLKIRFNDMIFPPTKTELQPEHDKFLAQFSALLKDKPDENITLCAVATAADIGKKAGADISSKDDISKLKIISLARMNNFKSYMVDTQQLNSSRLLLCTPQIDSDVNAKARITFSN